MNGGVKAANKILIRILEKMVKTYRDWSEMLSYALWAYRTSVRSATGTTPYELAYEMEAVLPVEIEILSLRILLESEVEEGEWQQARYDQLHLADEKCMHALSHSQCYESRIAWAYNKRVRKRSFKVSDMVMKRILPPHLPDPRGKFKPSWDGLLIIREVEDFVPLQAMRSKHALIVPLSHRQLIGHVLIGVTKSGKLRYTMVVRRKQK
ncbi:uncharacterized protein LOC131245815 [Magnolia sinica]|uniref:uncharacterized protein LOC131245815 n=1 Tax=Magnolia sinica TaxID=86752 RepID=UPI002657F0A7|nr:uncharacterized protein LOC131245815 [Magnolia sinica]